MSKYSKPSQTSSARHWEQFLNHLFFEKDGSLQELQIKVIEDKDRELLVGANPRIMQELAAKISDFRFLRNSVAHAVKSDRDKVFRFSEDSLEFAESKSPEDMNAGSEVQSKSAHFLSWGGLQILYKLLGEEFINNLGVESSNHTTFPLARIVEQRDFIEDKNFLIVYELPNRLYARYLETEFDLLRYSFEDVSKVSQSMFSS
ncbi:MAG: hypothetical protein AB8B68_01445 [Rickettsiaceae bacterium]